MSKKITVVTVCFNAESVLEQTMLSVLNQTYKNFEYLIIDGGSKDGTLDIIKKYSDKVKWISEPDNGLYDAMNKGVKMASGEWINFMNAGDRFASNDVLEKIFAKEYPEDVKFLYSDNYYVDEKGNKTYAKHDHTIPSILHQSAIYRPSLHSQYGFYAVTPKIIISDFLFFCMVPEKFYKKVDTVISINTVDGVSGSALWCGTQRLCAMVVFRKLPFGQMLLKYVKFRIVRALPFLKKIK